MSSPYFEVAGDNGPYDTIDQQLGTRLLSAPWVFVGIYKPSMLRCPDAQEHIWDQIRESLYCAQGFSWGVAFYTKKEGRFRSCEAIFYVKGL